MLLTDELNTKWFFFTSLIKVVYAEFYSLFQSLYHFFLIPKNDTSLIVVEIVLNAPDKQLLRGARLFTNNYTFE